MAKAAVIILNWNGEKLLREFLPSVVEHTDPAWGRVVVVDNGSKDGSGELMKKEFPAVDLICFPENLGFAGGYNRAVESVSEEIVVLLNSDVEVTANWLQPLVGMLEACPELAAVQPKIKAWRNRDYFEYAGACGGFIDRLGFPFCRGRILDVLEEDRGQYDDEAEVFWCSGAALCVRREAYCRAGGLDERFFAHMEEIDLCWRIRNLGAVLKACPASVVYHLGGGSLPMNHPRKLFLNYRNNLLMLYKNLSPQQWKKVKWQRRGLDFMAMMVFALQGKWTNAKAVARAYRDFGRMKKNYRPEETTVREDCCIYPRSLIFQYYFKHIRKFSQLER